MMRRVHYSKWFEESVAANSLSTSNHRLKMGWLPGPSRARPCVLLWLMAIAPFLTAAKANSTSLKPFPQSLAGTTVNIPRACAPPHDHYPFCNVSLTVKERLDDLIGRLSLEEKPLLLTARESPRGNISRLGIPEYDWGGNCVHGVQSRCAPLNEDGSNGRCPTSFPNPNLLGATFNETLWEKMGAVIGVELRALWLQNVGENHLHNVPHIGLDCWSPNVNIVRDPRWGRNLETPSEDPYVCGKFGTTYTLGLQRNSADPRYLQAVATLKHFDANSLEGPHWMPNGTWSPAHGHISRNSVNTKISLYDLSSTYLPAFKMAVQEGGAAGVMCSYNRINGVPSCANELLLKKVLRQEWGFRGYVTSDSGAIDDFLLNHKYTETWEETVAAGIRAGCDIESASWSSTGHPWATGGRYIAHLPEAVRMGLVSETAVDLAVRNALDIRFRLGLFDPIDEQPFWHVSPQVVESEEHVSLAKEATAQGFVLLKNDNSIVPLDPSRKIAIIGPHTRDRHVMTGNYVGEICRNDSSNACVASFLEGFSNITQMYGGLAVASTGCPVFGNDTTHYEEALKTASSADAVVFLGGLNLHIEREGTDRPDISLPTIQVDLLQQISKVNPNIVLVLLHGGIVAIDEVVDSIAAVVSVGYPGRYAGMQLPKALFGLTENAWGKLPVTWYKNSIVSELNMVDFDMSRPPGRTYRYYRGQPLFPFGFGLNPLTAFALTNAELQPRLCRMSTNDTAVHCAEVDLSAYLTNTGTRAGDEVLLASFAPRDIPKSEPASKLISQLFAFKRLHLIPGESRKISFSIANATLQLYDDAGMPRLFAGRYMLQIGTGTQSVQELIRLNSDGMFELSGKGVTED